MPCTHRLRKKGGNKCEFTKGITKEYKKGETGRWREKCEELLREDTCKAKMGREGHDAGEGKEGSTAKKCG